MLSQEVDIVLVLSDSNDMTLTKTKTKKKMIIQKVGVNWLNALKSTNKS